MSWKESSLGIGGVVLGLLISAMLTPIQGAEVGTAMYAGNGGGPTVPVPRFAICPGNIQDVLVVKDEANDREMWRLAITLDSVGKEQAESFSREHLGEVTELVFDGAVLIRERLQAVVDSGKILTSQWHSRAAVTEISMLFRNQSLDVPCGPIARLMK